MAAVLSVAHPAPLSFLHAVIIGLLQGVTELFPVSSLGHSVLLPAWLHWSDPALKQSVGESPYLAFVVGLHVATALALIAYFWRDWVRLIKAWFVTVGKRRIETPDERLIWLLIVATIPAGIAGLAFEHKFRTLFAKPLAAAIFLSVNAVILFAGELLRRRDQVRTLATNNAGPGAARSEPARQLDTLEYREAGVIGVAQIAALLAGISRSGITMVAGLVRGLDHEDAARFSFLLATPIILAAGVYKIPDLTGHLGDGMRGQALAGAAAAAVAAFVAVRFLMRYFETKTLTPFAVYCALVGVASMIRFGLF
jgi:undecaprenyl-diphosphatase